VEWKVKKDGANVFVRLEERGGSATVERSHEGAAWIAEMKPKDALRLAAELVTAASETLR
jgi:hypothetical protein